MTKPTSVHELREQAEEIAADAPVVEGPHRSLAAALVAALADLSVVERGNTAKIPTKDGGSYAYSYADIADVVKLTRPKLAAHGVVALTPVHEHGRAGLHGRPVAHLRRPVGPRSVPVPAWP